VPTDVATVTIVPIWQTSTHPLWDNRRSEAAINVVGWFMVLQSPSTQRLLYFWPDVVFFPRPSSSTPMGHGEALP